MKLFADWFKKKEKLETVEYEPPYINEGDLWWCSVGENIGVEVGGKSVLFTRPVIVIKRIGRYAFLGIPTTTKAKEGSWYQSFVHAGVTEVAMLHQIRLFSYKRLSTKIGRLDDADMQVIKKAFTGLLE
jgi:mRNA interferase MazF